MSNQSMEFSRLALEKNSLKTLLHFDHFQVLFHSPLHLLRASFEFLTSPLNKKCGRPLGEQSWREGTERKKGEGGEGNEEKVVPKHAFTFIP